MKMKDVFKLPLVINEEDAQSGAKSWWLSDSHRSAAISDMELFDEAEAICEAVNSHDTLESANKELLEALKFYADYENNTNFRSGRYGNFVCRGTDQDEWEADKGDIAHQAITKHSTDTDVGGTAGAVGEGGE